MVKARPMEQLLEDMTSRGPREPSIGIPESREPSIGILELHDSESKTESDEKT